MMKRHGLILLIAWCCLPFLFAQSPSPHVSQIKVGVRDSHIKITWKDSPDARGTLLVYRSEGEITPDTLINATLAGYVPYGTEFFIDTPNKPGTYYYAVLIQDPKGTVYKDLVPFRNKTVTPVLLESVASEQERGAQISSISAEVSQDFVTIRFIPSRGDRELILYRSTNPILTLEHLSLATEVKRFSSAERTITDYPVPGVPYYYAVVDAKLMEMKLPQLEKGNNVTPSYVEIPLPPAPALEISILPPLPETFKRPMPLPYYLLSKRVESGEYLNAPREFGVPPAKPIPPSTKLALEELIAPLERLSEPPASPTLLAANRGATDQREEQMLQAVIKGPFRNKNWKEALYQLNLLQKLPLSAEVRSQVLFYRGQAKYFLSDYREAFMDFLLASVHYFEESQQWMDRVLQTIRSQG